ncbi:hypothetical protein GQ43DRAFT_442232 [Delitschia confertaspora ATCC 74209]|uniref:DUF1989 domain-containing protein n=1 Tax=Delitschia confertaspora ATCC 74209 TaxID=1513339 RepID=A0A9P4JMV5_9PLEO|nr:hypothetical protein GQ43DRAFT_442232 [Delitschia confertaspora ATCC 74209]
MSGEIQTIPARHGVATVVPKGYTIKIINTYGKQVVSMWAFCMDKERGEEREEEELSKEQLSREQEEDVEKAAEGIVREMEQREKGDGDETGEKSDGNKGASNSKAEKGDQERPKSEDTADDPPEQTPEESKESSTEKPNEKAEKKGWSSYVPSMPSIPRPSIPYRSKGQASDKPNPGTEKGATGKKETSSKKWTESLPTGKGFSTYLPNVQIPDSKEVISAFKASHYRDPNKSYAEQLYDFSKTPVGAGSIAAATGSGTASSIYAAYTAYTRMTPSAPSQPPAEYLSLPHTISALHSLSFAPSSALLSNLRNPILTLIEDTSLSAHDTLTPACDARLYKELGVEKPEEHGSCAENLVLALRECNEGLGLKGPSCIGGDITVNTVPVPISLFMNTLVSISGDAAARDREQDIFLKDVEFSVSEPAGKKRSFVRFRAERDVVIVMSACPMDVGPQNGGKCMAANFIVEEENQEEEENNEMAQKLKEDAKESKMQKDKEDIDEIGNHPEEGDMEEQKEKGKDMPSGKPMPKPKGGPMKFAKKPAVRGESVVDVGAKEEDSTAKGKDEGKDIGKDAGENAGKDAGKERPQPIHSASELAAPPFEGLKEEPFKEQPKKKPKKLERRNTNSVKESGKGAEAKKE